MLCARMVTRQAHAFDMHLAAYNSIRLQSAGGLLFLVLQRIRLRNRLTDRHIQESAKIDETEISREKGSQHVYDILIEQHVYDILIEYKP